MLLLGDSEPGALWEMYWSLQQTQEGETISNFR
jgi:hypothetical protein